MKPNYLFLLISLFVLLIVNSCSKDKKDDPTPTTQVTPTCTDGIQNQGETGVDCGGPCPPCTTSLCLGNSSNDYFPLVMGNEWHYSYPGSPDFKLKISSTETVNNLTYMVMETESGPIVNARHYRIASNGDVMRLLSSGEYVEVPANPTVNQTWNYSSGELKVLSVTNTTTTDHCTYTDCLRLEYTMNGTLISYYVYKKGVGLVQDGTSPFYHQLKYLQLN